MRPFPPPDPVAAAFQTGFGPEFGAAFAGEDEFTLEPLRKALAALGDPHLRLPPLVHVAGTNGKGSTVAFTQAILTAAGLKVHAFTQPHLIRTTERLVIAGAPIAEEAFLALIERVSALGARLSHFEAQTACAFLAFAETPADAVVLEVGMGGLLDATNVVPSPAVCLIASIGADHVKALGGSLPAIARHKAGIIKPGAQVITAPQSNPAIDRVFEAQALRARCPLLMGGVDWTVRKEEGRLLVESPTALFDLPAPSLSGAHQEINAGLAVLGVDALAKERVSQTALAAGVARAHWPGRLHRIRRGPLAARAAAKGQALFADGGCNPPAAEALAAWIAAQSLPTTLIAGFLEDKDAEAFLKPLIAAGVRAVYASAPKGPRPPMPSARVLAAAERAKAPFAASARDVSEAVSRATAAAAEPGLILITGALSLVAEALWMSETAA